MQSVPSSAVTIDLNTCNKTHHFVPRNTSMCVCIPQDSTSSAVRVRLVKAKQKTSGQAGFCAWWAVQDLNLQPLECKSSTLPIELTALIFMSPAHYEIIIVDNVRCIQFSPTIQDYQYLSIPGSRQKPVVQSAYCSHQSHICHKAIYVPSADCWLVGRS